MDLQVNGHRDVDVATADEFSNSVSVLVNTGDGTLGTATSIDMGDSAESIVAGDWDLDGDIDLASASANDDKISLGMRTWMGQGPLDHSKW